MFCRKCGIKIIDNSTFCPQCGEQITPEEKSSSTKNTDTSSKETSTPQKPFREDFFNHIKSVLFMTVVTFGMIYYGVNIMNSVLHFTTEEVFISVMSILFGLISFSLTVPSLCMIYLDRSPHLAFVPIKLYAFINLLKLFMITAFGILMVIGSYMGKEEISKSLLYLAGENISLYLITLLSQSAKEPSLMLIFTSSILWITYIVASLLYHLSLIRLLNSTSKRINDNTTIPKGCNIIGSISYFVAILNFIYALSMYIFIKDDIYNVLLAIFKGLFYLAIFFDLRKFGKMFVSEDEEAETSE